MRDDKSQSKNIGKYLKQKRERLNESLAEVSGAVEIDIETLHRIEIGVELPPEDILVLLMSHFDIDDSEARRLFKVAGYDDNRKSSVSDDQTQNVFMVVPFNTQVMYADQVEVTSSTNGFVINFFQPGPNGQQMIVSRVGLSKELAKTLVKSVIVQTSHSPKLLASNEKLDEE